MARFTATLTGSYPNQRLKVTDAMFAERVVFETTFALHSPGTGSGGPSALAAAAITVENFELAFDSPSGPLVEMGFDLVFTLSAPPGGGPKEIGAFSLSGFNVGDPVELLNTGLINTFAVIPDKDSNKFYPGDVYSPIVVVRTPPPPSVPSYNMCFAMCYKAVEWNHGMYFRTPSTGTDNGLAAVTFIAVLRFPESPNPYFAIPEGETRTYRLRVNINDRTDTPVSMVTGSPKEWIWTLRGYQRFFRTLYGKPNYRSMGGWDGRPCYARFMTFNIPDGTRNFRPENDPTQTGGYNRVIDRTINPGGLGASPLEMGFQRVMIWSMAGTPDISRQPTYAFKIMTGIASLPSPAPETLNDMRRF